MDGSLSKTLLSRIATLLNSDDRNSAVEALQLCAKLPEPGTGPGGIPQLLFDVGFRLERFERNDDAIKLYRRVVRYPVADTQLLAGSWFRIALLGERAGNWIEARAGYRKALDLAPDWFYMAALAQYHLADLLAADEDYTEAATLYRTLEQGPPHPEIRPDRVAVELARCLLRSGRHGEALEKLNDLLALSADAPVAVEAYRLLAEIHECSGARAEAVKNYQCIVASSYAEPALRAAAAHRAAALLS